jgi:hypothetical protein
LRRLTCLLMATAALACGAVTLTATSAEAIPAVSCGTITVGHSRYPIRAHVLGCSRARAWAAAFLAHGSVPSGYDCQRYSAKVTRVLFLCDDPATVTNIDGPLSFSATR